MDWQSLYVSLKLATVTTLILLIISTPLAFWLAHTNNRFKDVVSAIVTLPIVMPSTVIGFYLLIFMGPNGPLGQITQSLGMGLLSFTFVGLVFGSIIYSLPFVVQPLRNSFEYVGRSPIEAAQVLGVSNIRSFFSIVLPLSKPGILTASVLGFAHTMGEFGLILMIGGSIPGETKVISVSIFESVESLEWSKAYMMSGVMLVSSFCLIFFMNKIQKKWGQDLVIHAKS